MTPYDDQHDDPQDDPQDDAVRRLLASAATPEPLPPEVGARLDDVLADLVAERRDPVVTPLRRRRWPQVLVAAAAVTAFGLAGTALVRSGTEDQADSATAGSAAEDVGEPETSEELGGGPAPAEELAPQSPTSPGDRDDLGSELDSGAKSRSDKVADSLTLYDRGLLLRNEVLESYGALDGANASRDLLRLTRDCPRPAARSGLDLVDLPGDRFALVGTRPVGRTSSVVTVYTCGEPRVPVASYVALGFR